MPVAWESFPAPTLASTYSHPHTRHSFYTRPLALLVPAEHPFHDWYAASCSHHSVYQNGTDAQTSLGLHCSVHV